jgi:hypothetical protein
MDTRIQKIMTWRNSGKWRYYEDDQVVTHTYDEWMMDQLHKIASTDPERRAMTLAVYEAILTDPKRPPLTAEGRECIVMFRDWLRDHIDQ